MYNLPIVCANIIQNSLNDFLLVREGIGRSMGKYSFPAGKIKNRRESLIKCAMREAREETGLLVNPRNLVGVYQKVKPENPLDDRLVYVYYSEVVSGKLTSTPKHPEVRYFSYRDILDLNSNGLLKSSYMLYALDDFLDSSFVR